MAEAITPTFGQQKARRFANYLTNLNKEILLKNQNEPQRPDRSPDSIAEDKSINLFDRVSSHYELFYRKILLSK
ncbi:MAG: hypothetical protein HY072_05075 [Deltaproteobacteria bacterium]|nr:hypothetical protein [Deltaproteobacteria bacterium]